MKKNLINDGRDSDDPESFLKEYHLKLINLYDNFYTKEAEAIAKKRKNLTTFFYNELIEEVTINELDDLLGF